jgi:cation:H+ antiporter
MLDAALILVFAAAATLSLAASWLLVTALERTGARFGLSEALLGMIAALAADAPEITAATTALVHHDQRIGAGVVIGSNVFNLAALIGLGALLAGRIDLHRRVVELSGAVALWIAGVSVALVDGAFTPLCALILVLAVMVPYTLALGLGHARLARLASPPRALRWLAQAVAEEEAEIELAIHPGRGRARDAIVAGAAVAVVVGASIAMERAGSKLGARHAVPAIVTGALVLAAVTSLPNAVAGVYLARRGRGQAALSTALNSNAINILAGLLIPTSIVGIAHRSAPTTYITLSYLVMTVLVLSAAYAGHGLRRRDGATIVGAYGLFVALLLAGLY